MHVSRGRRWGSFALPKSLLRITWWLSCEFTALHNCSERRGPGMPLECISFQARAMAAAASRAPSQLARRDALSLTASAPRLSDLLSNSRSGDAADWQVACELRRADADVAPRGLERGLAPRPASCCVARDRPTGDRQRPSAQQLNWADERSANSCRDSCSTVYRCVP